MLAAESLTCRRGRKLVFRDVGFTLGTGELLLVTGHNGSGKSSLLRMLAGLLPCAQGTVLWKGKPLADRSRDWMHYLGHLDAIKAQLTARETLGYWQALHGDAGTIKRGFLEPFGLAALGDTPVKHLSAGQKRRLALTRLALRTAPLWLLDEPATALDDKGQQVLGTLLAEHRQSGGIAVIATHQPEDFKKARRLDLDGVVA